VADGRPTREAYGEALVELGRMRPDVVVVEADISKSTKTVYFAREFPERFVNVGVAEQDAMMVAAGLASCGKTPFVSTYAIFGTMRAAEQVRTFIAYADLNVKIALSHGGLTPANDGATHQGTEDFGVFRTIPNMTVIMPADAHATKKAVYAAAKWKGPVYLRFTRDAVPYIYSETDCPFTIGRANVLRLGRDVTLIAIGDMVSIALEAADTLTGAGLSVGVLDMHTLKPLDVEAVLEAADASGAIVTVEDHNVLNGLGSAVCEVVAEQCLVPVKRIGIPDRFGQSGPYKRLLQHYGLSAAHVAAAAREVIARKTSRE
jgi:transketolase